MQHRPVAGRQRRAHRARRDRRNHRRRIDLALRPVAREAPGPRPARACAGRSRHPRRRSPPRAAPPAPPARGGARPLGVQPPVHRRRPRRRRALGPAPGGGEGARVLPPALEARPVPGGQRRRLVEKEDLAVARRPRPPAAGRGTRSGRRSTPGSASAPPRACRPPGAAARRGCPSACPRAATACRLPSGAQRFGSGEGRDPCPDRRMEIAERSSPNFGPRRDGLRPELVVLHYTAMATAEAALDRLCDPAAEVSAHYLIAEDGRVWRAGRRGDARLARRRRQLGRPRRRQLALDRHRARQRRPARRLPAVPRAADGARSSACSTASSPAGRSRRPASSPTPTWRPAARPTRARSSTGAASHAAAARVWAEGRAGAGARLASLRRSGSRPPATPRPTETGRRCSRPHACAGAPGRPPPSPRPPTWRRSGVAGQFEIGRAKHHFSTLGSRKRPEAPVRRLTGSEFSFCRRCRAQGMGAKNQARRLGALARSAGFARSLVREGDCRRGGCLCP